MKYIKKIGAILLSICLLVSTFSLVTYAAAGSVSISSKTGNVGSTVTITCTVKCSTGPIGLADVVLEYDASSLQYVSGTGGYSLSGGSGSVSYRGLTSDGTTASLSFTMKFKILKAGTHSITTSSASAHDIDEIPFEPSKGTGTITGKAPSSDTGNNNTGNNNTGNNNTGNNNTGNNNGGNSNTGNNDTQQDNRSKNNKLSSLQVYPGTLTPAFSADTTSYTVILPSDTTQVTISATAKSSKATVSVTGGKDLKLGANEAKVIVIAENGSSRAYNITIMCGEEEKIQINGEENTINEGFKDDQIPAGFSRTKVTYNERQYEALVNATGNLHLMSLQTEAGATFYIYNQEMQEFYTYVQIPIAEGKYIIPLPLSEEVTIFADYDRTTLTLQEKQFDAWKLNEEFSVAYVMNQEGVETLYRYDSIDGTFQRYTDIKVEDTAPVDTEKTWFPSEYYMYALIGLVALVAILWIAMVYFIASRKKRHEARKRKAQKKLEKQKRRKDFER